MSSYILCIFEGRSTEQNIANNLCEHILNEDDKVVLRASYGFNIYKLYEEISKDEFFDSYEIIAEELRKRDGPLRQEEIDVLEIADATKISDIYLFFDYDCHCSNADDEKLADMIRTFNDPQDRGLLCVSYPMVEAIRHQNSHEYEEVLHSIEDLENYKNWVKNSPELDRRYFNWGLFDLDIWSEISKQHLARANYLVGDVLELPEYQLDQESIFNKQLEKHVPENRIAVISAFPLMLFDYYGTRLMERLEVAE
ncbi:hypothetical protein J0673_13640 [Vibrio sp. Vb2736]|uniref:hypothetical protein n=1 Tax=Vibrio sp. Vb2736 TaxID=2816075 RepID=UPI001A8DDF9A|nr:hypothetical protein [Vibrio sp. Vb2736]MBO0137344.1 hypothetical protein [Vibrio sp. Vb2736]